MYLFVLTLTVVLHNGFQPIQTLQYGLLTFRLKHHFLKLMNEMLEVLCRSEKQPINLGMGITYARDDHMSPVAAVNLQTIYLEHGDDVLAGQECVECLVSGFGQRGLVMMGHIELDALFDV